MGAFLDRVSGLFDKGLVLAALFPLLIFSFMVFGVAATLFGPTAILHWFEELSTSQTLVLGTIFSVAIITGAFVLRSMRRPLLNAWSGDIAPPWLLQRERNRRDRLDESRTVLIWQNAESSIIGISPKKLGFFATILLLFQRRTTFTPLLAALQTAVDALLTQAEEPSKANLRRRFDQACAHLRDAYQAAGNNDLQTLQTLRAQLVNFVRPREREERLSLQSMAAKRLLAFAPPPILKATRLGNCLSAVDHYSYERYRMEGGIFWPHLEHMMKDNLRDDIQNQRILLDFLLALASLLVLLTLFAAFAGPWLYFDWIWLIFVGVGAGLSYAVYRLSIPAANALGTALRTGCDLYHHALLKALGLDVPDTLALALERELWKRISQLVIYGAPEKMEMAFRMRDEPASKS
jgi:hypothetical protein